MSALSRGSRTRNKEPTKLDAIVAAAQTEIISTKNSDDIPHRIMPADAPEPSMQLLAEAAQNESRILKNGTTPIMDQDDRSSSLSDLDDRPATEGTDNQKSSPSPVSEDDDTEAETERVEESPYKREQKNILLSSNESLSNGASNNATTALVDDDPKTDTNPSRNEVDEAIHISDISSLEDSGDEGSGPESPSSVISKKRKRFVDDETSTSLKKASMKLTSHAADQAAHDDDSPSPPADKISVNGEQAGDIEEGSEDEEEESDHDKNEGDDVAINERMDIDGEDADMEDAGGPEADVEQAGRNEEEQIKKKGALDYLGTIERQFALLRDRVFAERSRLLDEEQATLDSANITHPEYLTMEAAIDQHFRERIELARVTFSFKYRALLNKTVGERAIQHCQYFQTVREIRDSTLTAANKEWYEIQRERRLGEEEASAKLSHFVGDRPLQLSRQTAYNTEVSILSGMAKHVGFPAAPDIIGADQQEVDDDLKKMGISRQPVAIPMASTLSGASRSNQAAQEFLETNAWANPRHPAHMLHHAQVRAASPSTPANQKRPMDTNMTNGSASTIAASSLAPTPLSAEPTVNPPRRQSGLAIENIGETPSRPPPTSTHVKGATVGLSSMSEVTNSERLGVAAATSTTPSASPGKALHAESVHERLASEGAPVSRAQPVQQREISELSTEPSITAPFTPVNVMVARVRVGNS